MSSALPAPDRPAVPAPIPPRHGRGVFDKRRDHPRDRRSTRVYTKHGLDRLRTAVKQLGARTVDRRTRVGRALAECCDNLIADLGGPEALSTQQRALVETVVTTKLLLDSIDAWLLTQPSVIRKRALLPVVRERAQLADGFARYLGQLGLERREPAPPTVEERAARVRARQEAEAQPASLGASQEDDPAPGEAEGRHSPIGGRLEAPGTPGEEGA